MKDDGLGKPKVCVPPKFRRPCHTHSHTAGKMPSRCKHPSSPLPFLQQTPGERRIPPPQQKHCSLSLFPQIKARFSYKQSQLHFFPTCCNRIPRQKPLTRESAYFRLHHKAPSIEAGSRQQELAWLGLWLARHHNQEGERKEDTR